MGLGKTKAALLAAASIMAASAALSPAGAADLDPAVLQPATVIEAAAPVAHAADHAGEEKSMTARKWALLAAAAGALAGLVKLIGARRVADAISEGAVKTARAATGAASKAARAVGRAVSSPLRFLAMLFGLALFALTGAGFYDVEWIVGLVSGAALAGGGLFAMLKTKSLFQPIRVKKQPAAVRDNEN